MINPIRYRPITANETPQMESSEKERVQARRRYSIERLASGCVLYHLAARC